MQTGQFASAPDAIRLIVAKEGFKGLYAVSSAFSNKLYDASVFFIIGVIGHFTMGEYFL